MKSLIYFLLMMVSLQGFAKKEVRADRFIIQGQIFEVDIMNETDKSAQNVQIIVYQDKEVYASFYCKENGAYEFILPIGHEYELWFGGKDFVNKKAYVDTRSMPAKSSGYECNLDIGLFRPLKNVEFPCLVDHYVKVRFDSEYKQLIPDYEYSQFKAKEVEKAIRKAKKTTTGF